MGGGEASFVVLGRDEEMHLVTSSESTVATALEGK